jgi:hypothetical protein
MSFAAMRSSLFSLRTSSLPLRRAFSTSPISPLARLSLIGRLAATPELIHTASGNEVVKYALGVSYGLSSDRKTSWFNVASFQKEGPSRDYLTSLEKGYVSDIHLSSGLNIWQGRSRQGLRRRVGEWIRWLG